MRRNVLRDDALRRRDIEHEAKVVATALVLRLFRRKKEVKEPYFMRAIISRM